ncbi:hypothetical protein AXF42_Ash011373 [Apostasia shenzhenica]|uniref:NAD-dependent epimerase/dehydratase domain-containing protein n=1 Tax=Apostasia shenzhenica TaxID=1088818 RepID=A0A2I0AED3_9ASPA|nr:hypothetical protein AXF42_Ash011373 [Apostasia shenzhenica]
MVLCCFGRHVSGTCRDDIKRRELEKMGFDAFTFNINNNELGSLSTLGEATHILISIPSDVNFGDPLMSLHEDLRCSLSSGNLQWLGYLSSTSVYGNCGGAWVDEDYPVDPSLETTKSRLAAEISWQELGCQLGCLVNVFRLGGIYGPGRSALNTIIEKGPTSKKQSKRNSKLYTSRVHVADIYQSINASFKVPSSGRIYNIVDDDPAPRAEVFAFARALIEKKWPGLIVESEATADVLLPMEGSSGEKRVSNARLKKELGVSLLYPSYREGLKSIIASLELPSNSIT